MDRILVIEDDESVRSSIIELLNEEGFETYEAENGRAGIEKAKQISPALIISDILMPEVDGYGVLTELQKDQSTSSIPFIFLSARTGASDIRMGMNIGADDYLTKPYKADDLLNAVNSRLRKKNNSEEKLNKIFKNISMTLPHELRTPLISVLGYSQIINEDVYDLDRDNIAELAQRINTAGFDLLKLVEKFLVFTRLEVTDALKKKYDLINESRFNEPAVLISNAALETAQKFNRVEDLHLNVQNMEVRISEEHLKILVTELIENAFKFSKEGTAVNISLVHEGEFGVCKIEDSGVGMTNEQIKEIGTFRQFDREIHCQMGTGLGLTIANKIAEIYQLGLSIESKVQNSTIIKIFLPIKKLG